MNQQIIDNIMIDSLFTTGRTLSEKQARMLAWKAESARTKLYRVQWVIKTAEDYIKELLHEPCAEPIAESHDQSYKFNRITYNRMNAKEQKDYEARLAIKKMHYWIRRGNTTAELTQAEYILAKYFILPTL